MAESLEQIKFLKDTSQKTVSIKKMDVIQLREVLAREESLLKNKLIMSKLPDKGNSIKKFYECVKQEIQNRENLADINAGLQKLNISEADKHVQKICGLETNPKKERYKPFSTLNKIQEIHTDRKVFKTMEDWSKCNKPTKLILLSESLEILKQQDEKVKEQVKIKQGLLFNSNEEDDSTDSEKSETSDDDD
ncbi:unnamed protein product [Psylliodes chrysocephalus]|uniref:Uncharacterized protein n=1 Tax=Psylliodes chrysocephalus TaxID=3402493 RepID=A0A9P0CYL6_9CUCU|nr:unnamed protein product [Psylliodes chrysocephala]